MPFRDFSNSGSNFPWAPRNMEVWRQLKSKFHDPRHITLFRRITAICSWTFNLIFWSLWIIEYMFPKTKTKGLKLEHVVATIIKAHATLWLKTRCEDSSHSESLLPGEILLTTLLRVASHWEWSPKSGPVQTIKILHGSKVRVPIFRLKIYIKIYPSAGHSWLQCEAPKVKFCKLSIWKSTGNWKKLKIFENIEEGKNTNEGHVERISTKHSLLW